MQHASTGPRRERGVVRTLQLLEALHRIGRPVRIGELARTLGAPRSSLYELAKLLTEAGILETASPDGEIFLGGMLSIYGLDYLREHDLIRRGQAEVDRLTAETGETAHICTRTGGH